LLDVEGISVAFGGVPALLDVSVQVSQGSIVGVIGPNGAGKTTLFNVISGLLKADAGFVRFNGNDVTSLPPNKRAGLGIGRSFQNLGLITDQTVRINLLAAQYVGASYRSWDLFVRPWRWRREERRMDDRATEAAGAFGLTDKLEERVADLSFGQSRFAELACILAEYPRLMLLDEPTTGLDIRATERLRRQLLELRAGGQTILLVAHNVRFVMDLCNWVYVLASGRVLASGPPEAVHENEKVAEVYLGATRHGR
jgi:ABC-type branched-subunit amino acid transport system ATPase component